MRELTTYEMEHISGAGVFDTIAAIFIGSVTGITTFGVKWAMSGGDTGGLLGAGIISGSVGLVTGAVVGMVDGALYGAINGWDTTVAWFNKVVENTFDPDAPVITA
ncbi:hypothetical protein [Pantoea sp. KPR_PJ]|uniref:hypothetical protein n=1 Tax=Pantoea sp. KPR_PJ TaxID=2738375 RepID=UPI003528A244